MTLLVLPESSMMSLASVLDAMRAANRLSHDQLFAWTLTTFEGKAAQLTCGVSINPDIAFHTQLSGDMLIIISGFNQHRHVNQKRLNQLQVVVPRFKMVGGVESGSWILARLGKLDHRKATTHWEDLEDFALCFPQVRVEPSRYIIDHNVFTTGGASPSFDFILHLIRQRYSHKLAMDVASVFNYDESQRGQDSQSSVALGWVGHHEPRVGKAIRLMESRIENPLSLEAIAQALNLSVRTLEYLFTQSIKLPPGQYYLHLRLQTARRLVMDTRLPMYEIALRTGFGSLPAFSRQFKKHFNLTPSQCRKAGPAIHKS